MTGRPVNLFFEPDSAVLRFFLDRLVERPLHCSEMSNLRVENEIHHSVDLCLPGGKLNQQSVGYSRQPLQNCKIPGHWPRKKQWNYWCIYDSEFLISLTVSNLDYAGVCFVYWLQRARDRFEEYTEIAPLGRGVAQGPTLDDPAGFQSGPMEMIFQREPGADDWLVQGTVKKKGQPVVEVDLRIHAPDETESLNVVVPWNLSEFQFTSKRFGLSAEGTIRTAAGEHHFRPESSFAVLDFGRGVWPYESKWNWACGALRKGGRQIAWNLGAGWTDGTPSTENGILVDGRLHKISEDVQFEFDRSNYRRPWRIYTPGSRTVDLTLTTEYERVAKSNLLLIKSEVHQMIGKFSGSLRVAGETIQVQKGSGWAEDHIARW